MLRAAKTVSTETAAGRHSSSTRVALVKRKSSRFGRSSAAGGRKTPQPSSRRRPSSKRTTPYPVAVVPGSKPRTFTGGTRDSERGTRQWNRFESPVPHPAFRKSARLLEVEVRPHVLDVVVVFERL